MVGVSPPSSKRIVKGARVLVVDDDAAIRIVIEESLRREGYRVQTVASLGALRDTFGRFKPDLLITDVILPDGDGLDLLPDLLAARPKLPVIVLSAQNTLTTAVRATEHGAFDYLPKPFDLGALNQAVRSGLSRSAASEIEFTGSSEAELPMIGRSPPMQEVYRLIARLVGNDLSVLVLGESGTGKELVARAIHDLGNRRAKPFIAVNMAAIPRDLIEAELFGHERGAFTGAAARSVGRFEEANGGTLFLDEIGDMPMEAQTRLLRVLQTGTFTSIGGRIVSVNVRIVAATHQNLARLIAAGKFRDDLYYRLNVVPVVLPPLRDRGEDIVQLAQFFLEHAAKEGLPRRRLSSDAEARLRAYSWPGNVRELDNLMRRLAATSRDVLISEDLVAAQLANDLQDESIPLTLPTLVETYLRRYFNSFGNALPPTGVYDRILADVELPLLQATLAAVSGNQLRAAAVLGINRNTLRKKMNELGIVP